MKFIQGLLILLSFSTLLNCNNPSNEVEVAVTGEIQNNPIPTEYNFPLPDQRSDGWTDLEKLVRNGKYNDARVIFVSASNGNDSTAQNYTISDVTFDAHGMFQAASTIHAYATLTAAYGQIREDYPDILLLNRGDQWSNERFDQDGAGRLKSGRSFDERHIIASYGSGDRPRLFESIIDARGASYTIVTGLHFYTNDWLNADRALQVTGAVNHQLYEDMRFDRHYKDKIEGGTDGIQNVAIRRCFYSHYEAHDGFIYAARVSGLLLEENVFYKPFQKGVPDESEYGRHLYLSPSGLTEDDKHALTDLVIRGNIFYYGGRGNDFRGGGHVYNNLFLRGGFLMGGHGGSSGSIQSGNAISNVFMEGSSTDFQNINGAEIAHNIYTDPLGITAGITAITIKGDIDSQVAINQKIHHNIVYGVRGGPDLTARGIGFFINGDDPAMAVRGIEVYENEFQYPTGSEDMLFIESNLTDIAGLTFKEVFDFHNNHYFSTSPENSWFNVGSFEEWIEYCQETGATKEPITYPAPERNIRTYNASLGGSQDTEDFMSAVMEQSRHNWRPEYTAAEANNYIRAGFNMAAVD